MWRGREGKKERTAGLTQGSATHHRRMMSCRPSSRHMVEAKVNLFPFFSQTLRFLRLRDLTRAKM